MDKKRYTVNLETLYAGTVIKENTTLDDAFNWVLMMYQCYGKDCEIPCNLRISWDDGIEVFHEGLNLRDTLTILSAEFEETHPSHIIRPKRRAAHR